MEGAASSKVGQKEIGEHISEMFGKSRNAGPLVWGANCQEGGFGLAVGRPQAGLQVLDYVQWALESSPI